MESPPDFKQMQIDDLRKRVIALESEVTSFKARHPGWLDDPALVALALGEHPEPLVARQKASIVE